MKTKSFCSSVEMSDSGLSKLLDHRVEHQSLVNHRAREPLASTGCAKVSHVLNWFIELHLKNSGIHSKRSDCGLKEDAFYCEFQLGMAKKRIFGKPRFAGENLTIRMKTLE